MISNSKIPELVERVDTETIRVHAPIPTIFLCGGKIDASAIQPPSLREAFSRVFYTHTPFQKYGLVMAEDVNAFFPDGQYNDILSFESDLAQIAELIILFSESIGSAAELGAFAMVEEIALRTLAVLDDHNYNERSFIKLGPIRLLENRFGPTSVCVLYRDDIKIQGIGNIAGLDLATFAIRMGAAVEGRHSISKDHTTFNKDRAGHLIKVIAGLIQHYGALTKDEIELFLEALGCRTAPQRTADFLLCARAMHWILEEKRGIQVYYASLGGNEALQFKSKPGLAPIDKNRWRVDIRAYWEIYEPERYSVIQNAVKRSTR